LPLGKVLLALAVAKKGNLMAVALHNAERNGSHAISSGGRGMNIIRQFVRDDQGADLIEYALLVGLIALAAVTALGVLGGSITTLFTSISTTLDGLPGF
jgi:pilus assembly protein Flp/PilA